MDSKVLNNLTALKSYAKSIGCALIKAGNGSDVEDAYVMEKLRSFACRMGYKLERINKVGAKTTTVLLHIIEYEYMDGEELNAIDREHIEYCIGEGQSEGELDYHDKGTWKIRR